MTKPPNRSLDQILDVVVEIGARQRQLAVRQPLVDAEIETPAGLHRQIGIADGEGGIEEALLEGGGLRAGADAGAQLGAGSGKRHAPVKR